MGEAPACKIGADALGTHVFVEDNAHMVELPTMGLGLVVHGASFDTAAYIFPYYTVPRRRNWQ